MPSEPANQDISYDAIRERYDAALRIVEVANRAVDMRSVLEASVRELIQELPCDAAMVLLPDERGRILHLAYQSGVPQARSSRPMSFPVSGSLYGEVFQSGEARVVDDVASEVAEPVGGSVPLRSIAVVPLRSRDRSVGVLSIGARGPAVFDDGVLRQLRRFAGLIGLATSHALLQNRSSRRNLQLVALNRIAAAVSGTLSRDGVLSAAMSELEDATQFTAISLYGIDADGRRLVRLAARGVPSGAAVEMVTLPLYGEYTNLVQALQRRRPLAWWLREESLDGQPGLIALRGAGFRTFVMIPMSARGQLAGAITAASLRARAIDDGDAAILMAVGSQVGTALKNAELYEAARHDADTLERKVRARTVALRNRNQLLRHVTSWLSHDMKRPLRSVHALTEVLIDEASQRLSSEHRDLLERVLGAAERMSRRLSDLLDFVDIGAVEATDVCTDLDAVLDTCLEELAEGIELRGVRVLRGAPWPTAAMDARLAYRLIHALLTYSMDSLTGADDPTLRLGRRDGDGDDAIVCVVADNGESVDEALRARLFHQQPWGSEATSAPERGTRLFMAREIAETHGGRLWYESTDDRENAFLFEIHAVEVPK